MVPPEPLPTVRAEPFDTVRPEHSRRTNGAQDRLVEARTAPIVRLTALVVALALAWPTPAFALRPAGLEESNQRKVVAGELSTAPPSTVTPTSDLAKAVDAEAMYRARAVAFLRGFLGGYLLKKELAAAIGAHSNMLSPSRYDFYKPLIAAENARRTRENVALDAAGQPRLRRIATSADEAIDYAIEDHPGGDVTVEAFAQFANIPYWTLEHAHHPARLAAGNAKRAAETPPRPAVVIVRPEYQRVHRARRDTAGPSTRLRAGLEEPGANTALTELLTDAGREAARQRIIASLRQHPGGRTNTLALAQAAGMSRRSWYQVGGLALLDAENAARLEEDILRRANDQPLRSLIIRRWQQGYDARAALQEVLQQTGGYFLPPGEAARQAGISVGITTPSRRGYKTLARDENARRQRANVLRQAMRKPPIPRIGTTAIEAAAYVLEDQPGGLFSSKELASAVGTSGVSLRPFRVRALYEAENARRVAERESRKASNRPWCRLALTVEEAIQFAIEEHPGGKVTAYELAAFAGVPVQALWEMPSRFGGEGYRQRIDAKNPDRIQAGLPPILIVPKSPAPILHRHRARRDRATTGLEENDKAKAEIVNALAKAARLPAIEDLAPLVEALDDHPGGEVQDLDALRKFLLAKPISLVGVTNAHLAVVAEAQNRRRLAVNMARRETEATPTLRPLLVRDARLRLLNYLQQFPGGKLPLQTLAKGAGYSSIHALYPHHQATGFDFREVIAADNALRLEANVARRASDLSLLPLTMMSKYDSPAALLDALQQFRGGYLQIQALVRGARVSAPSANRLGWHANDDAGHLAAENARRQRTNAIRRTLDKPPIPRIAHHAALALQYALEDWWKPEPPTQEQIIVVANISPGRFTRHFDAVLPAANATRVAHGLRPLPAPLASTGLEEQTAARWRQLEEGRTERGVVVIPTRMMSSLHGLKEFLDTLPQAFADDVMLWFDGDHETV